MDNVHTAIDVIQSMNWENDDNIEWMTEEREVRTFQSESIYEIYRVDANATSVGVC